MVSFRQEKNIKGTFRGEYDVVSMLKKKHFLCKMCKNVLFLNNLDTIPNFSPTTKLVKFFTSWITNPQNLMR